MNTLGDRMKAYEEVSKGRLVKRMPVIIRLDGRAFHTFTRGLKKPHDVILHEAMMKTISRLVEEVQNCVFAYTQSDEITLVLVDYKTINTECWFDNEVQKMASTSAAMASVYFNKYFKEAVVKHLSITPNTDMSELEKTPYYKTLLRKTDACPTFDSRVFNVPVNDVVNCVLWRQQDCTKNAINSFSLSMLSPKELNGKSGVECVEMMKEKGYDFWNDTPTHLIRGTALYRDNGNIVCDLSMPDLKLDRWFLERLIKEEE